MQDLAKKIGANIRKVRKEKNISQDGFALLCGLDRSYMGRVEHGEVNLTVEKLHHLIAKPLGCSAASLLP